MKSASETPSSPASIPLIVDLDGTLIRSDLLLESFWNGLCHNAFFTYFIHCILSLAQGIANLKAYLASVSNIAHSHLPYNPDVLAFLKTEKKKGRALYLATAADKSHAEAVAVHLGLFEGVFASQNGMNLKSHRKAEILVDAFGEGRFDYIGNSADDLAIWQHTHLALVANAPKGVISALKRRKISFTLLSPRISSPRSWFKALRIHQYAKNVLLFVPIVTSHSLSLAAIGNTLLGFVAFSLCASSVYLLNDMMDLDADRKHPTKCNRPFASGLLPLTQGMLIAPLLWLTSMAVGLCVSLPFTLVLLGYFVLTTAYSMVLKRKMMVDVVLLAALYTLRVVAGAVAIDVQFSEFLLMFCVFIFTFLALVKRYTELAVRGSAPSNRGYVLEDANMVAMLAAASGLNAVTVFAFYISSPSVIALYTMPQLLWLIPPLLIYWIGRVLILAHRGQVEDDPIAFALKDRASYLVGLVALLIILMASALSL
jgi:4-hydroxybenzoate polyprenyltransferase